MTVRRLLPLVTLLAIGGCSDEGPDYSPGSLTATVVSPNGPEGAAVVSLSTGATVNSVGGTQAYAHAGLQETRVVLINPAGGELSFEIFVNNAAEPPVAAVLEVAGPDDALRADVSAYSVEFRR